MVLINTICYTSVYTLGGRIFMDVETLHKYTKGKSKIITFKINPQLLSLLDKTIKQEADIHSRSELFERCILRFLSEKGKLK
jgi:hypothetical protein